MFVFAFLVAIGLSGCMKKAEEYIKTTPDELIFECNFEWENKENYGENKSLCYFKSIQTADEGTAAKFSFGEYLNDGWPVYLTQQTEGHYIFDSSERSFVERVRIIIDVTDTWIVGTIENTTPDTGYFVRGSFTGKPITIEQYRAAIN